jgi:hypothetical protein
MGAMMKSDTWRLAFVRLVRFAVSFAVIWMVADYWYPAVGVMSVLVAGFALMVFGEANLDMRQRPGTGTDETQRSS